MSTLIEGGRIWTGVLGQPPIMGNILVEQGKIKAIYRPEEHTETLFGEERLDASSKTVIPGLINAHTHVTFDPESHDPIENTLKEGSYITLIKAIRSAKKYLKSGVTTIRDLGAIDGIDFALKRAINEGLIIGPRMLVSGKCLCMTGGHGRDFGTEVDGVDAARRGARLRVSEGADVIKVMATGGMNTPTGPGVAQLNVEELKAIVEEAHKVGKRVAAHANGNQGIKNAIIAGVDTIEHGILLDEEAIQMMLNRGVYLIPTLSVGYLALKSSMEGGIPEQVLRKSKQLMEARSKSFKAAHDAGIKIALGTDQGIPQNLHGSILQEFRLMIENGSTPEEALLSATSVAANALGIEDQVGSIEVGKFADILAIDGNPLSDITSLEKIAWVMKEGQVIFH